MQSQTLMTGRGARHFVQAGGLPLSLKTITNGRARYRMGRNEFTIDDNGWLIVNQDEPYTIEIAAARPVETFIIWFPRGWAEDVLRSATTSASTLLDAPQAPASAEFFARYTPNEAAVAPIAAQLRTAVSSQAPVPDVWLEQRLRDLLARMFGVQRDLARAVARLPAVRAATRDELWRRLNRARDFIHAQCDAPLQLADMARVAAMSPSHFLRAFKVAFAVTPHDWLTRCRMERAKFLLQRTTLSVTEVCGAIGYESLGSFSTSFLRATGFSPTAWRRRCGARRAIRNFEEAPDAAGMLSSAASP